MTDPTARDRRRSRLREFVARYAIGSQSELADRLAALRDAAPRRTDAR